MSAPVPQLTIEVLLTPEDRRQALLDDARRGLADHPKSISPVWFYDERGSELFEQITRLPEYYPTRTERRLLERYADDIARRADSDTLVELGSGSSEKTILLLDAMAATGKFAQYCPLDVSEEALIAAAEGVAAAYPGVRIHALVGDFHRHLANMPEGERRTIAFLGSTIGNLDPAERRRFLVDLDRALGPQDHLLLGVDLVKDPSRLVAAYDDASGVTAAFNKNALVGLNNGLGANFRLELFQHVAKWDERNRWIEMRLRALSEHTVRIAALDLEIHFERGEELRTEISSKFTADGVVAELTDAGFIVEKTWEDPGEFLLLLARPRS